jgi:DNA polymerase I
MSPKELFVIDGHNVLYRAHFAFLKNPLINTKKRDVSVAYGFTRMLLTLLKDRQPAYMAIAFDRKAPTFRHELYKQYKLNRPPMPAPIADNLLDIQEIIRALGIRIIEADGYEADDLLGSVVEIFKNDPVHIYLVSKDKDMLQLVNDKVTVLSTRQGLSDLIEFRQPEVVEKFGVPPEQMLDYFSMVGDSIDNVPGITGVGPKTAVKLLESYGSLEGLYEHAEDIKGKVGENIRNEKEFAFLARTLISLKLDADLPADIESYRIQTIKPDELLPIMETLEFKSLIHLLGLQNEPHDSGTVRYHTIASREELVELARRMRSFSTFAVDTETDGVDPMRCKLAGMSLSFSTGEAFYIPVGHQTEEKQVSLADLRETVGKILENPTALKVGQNTKFDRHVLDRHGFHIDTPWFDTMLADYLLDSGRRQHNLDLLAEVYLDKKKIPVDTVIGKGAKAVTMDQAPLDSVSTYACEDADVTLQLYPILKSAMQKEQLSDLYNDVEIPLVDVLIEMERAGVGLDINRLKRLGTDLKKQIDDLEDQIYCLAGETFNINSPLQLSDILFKKLGYPTRGIKKIKTGISTAESEMRKLANRGGLFREFPEKILEYRALTKLVSTYIDPLPELVHPETGRLHTSFNQAVTETGRLSSSNPNLQNIPIRNTTGRAIRRAFVPAPGNRILSADYSQMELRILAHIAKDKALIEAFHNGLDIHAATASKIFNTPIDQVTTEQRRRAKMVNFGIDYGMTPFGLSERLGIGLEEAKDYITAYLDQFRGVQEYIENTKEHVTQYGWVATLMGRKRPIHIAGDSNRTVREIGYRQAINMRIQGTAADIIKIAMIRISREMNRRKLKSRMILQIHDELLFDIHPEEKEELSELVRDLMEHAYTLCIPLVVDINTGDNWADAH